MNSTLLLLIGFAVLMLLLLVWVLRDPRKHSGPDGDLDSTDELSQRHVSYFPQVRQALGAEDFAFLSSRGSLQLARRIRRERRKIALAYLSCLRGDFLKLWRLARVIASMSPQVGVAQELARLRLRVAFSLRYEMIRIEFLFGFAPLLELGSLSDVVSRLSIRLETAMNNLGERAALAAKLASSLNDGHGLDTR
ncbi:MAG TPA: hypothetical protein VKH63_09810 [Candidatus Acidoferrum sp.]|nr:hypothetical protein [Candidatus Acidoferrum sp.]